MINRDVWRKADRKRTPNNRGLIGNEWVLKSREMGVETAFLYEEIDEETSEKSPVGIEAIEPGSSSEDCYQLLKAYMVYVKQQGNFGRNLWT